MAKQIPLDLETSDPFSAARFVTTPALAAVVRDVLAAQSWPAPQACLVGPQGCGKTHLLHMFADTTGGQYLTADATRRLDMATLSGTAIAIDDAERADQETLFHLYNRALANELPLLLASHIQPLAWEIILPDLTSRVRSVRVLTMPEPDETLLMAVLKKLFERRFIHPTDDALDHLSRRMERSVTAAQKIVTDLEHYANGRAFNKALVRDYLEQTRGLFDDRDP